MEKRHLIILTGWAVDPLVWRPLSRLLDEDYHITVVGWEDVASVEGLKEKAAAVIKEKEIRKCSLIGWSLGALVALELADALPERIDHMVLFSATCRFTKDEATGYRSGWYKAVVDSMLCRLKTNPEETLEDFYKNLFTRDEVIKGHYGHFLKEMEGALKVYSLEALSAGLEYLILRDLRETALRVDTPTLLIHGDTDRICPVKAGMYMKKHLKAAELIILPETGHMPFYTKTGPCFEIIKNFL